LENIGNILKTARENKGRIDYDYKVGQKVLLRNKGILRNIRKSHGQLRQSMQMEQSQFNAETN
jgi:hypothetical protein